MIDVLVQREQVIPYRAPDIVDPLITTEEVAVARGKDFLCENGAGFQPVTYSFPFQKGVRLGQLVMIRDAILGVDIKGKIVAVEHKIIRDAGMGGGEGALHALTTITVKTPTNFTVISEK